MAQPTINNLDAVLADPDIQDVQDVQVDKRIEIADMAEMRVNYLAKTLNTTISLQPVVELVKLRIPEDLPGSVTF